VLSTLKTKPAYARGLWVVLLLHLLYSTASGQSHSVPTYRNPVIAGDFADPSVIRVGDTFYAAGTSSEWAPAYPLYRSQDLVNWQYLGPIFKEMPAWTMGSYWAPELYHRDGTFYVYYTARRKSDQRSYIGVATTRNLGQGFTDHGCILEWTSEAIDAFVVEQDGKHYITWKAYGLDQDKPIQLLGRELTADGLKVTGEVFTLLQAEDTNWEAGGLEGQALFRHGRYWYMTYSGNACCGKDCNYQVGLARALTLQGPWEKYSGNPVMYSDQNWKCPGHGTVVTTADNRYFYLHHAYHSTDFAFTGRQGLLSELVWNEPDGWPVFRNGPIPALEAASPLGAQQRVSLDTGTDFTQANASLPWVWDVSRPKPTFAVRQGSLQLTGNESAGPAGTFLGMVVKKGSYSFTATILPQVKTLQSVCVYGDAQNALGAGVSKDSLEIWQVKAGIRQVLLKRPLPKGKQAVQLRLRGRQAHYELSWAFPGSPFEPIGPATVDGSFLPPWDRAPRVGISVSGKSGAKGAFRSVRLKYD